MRKITLWFSLGLLILCQYPGPAFATGATLAVSPSSLSADVGKIFTANITLSTSQAVDAAGGTISYPSNVLDVVSVSQTGSLFTLWTDTPTASNLKFGGGASYPGFTGNGKIFSITFKAKQEGTGTISITSAKALSNGTSVLGGANSASVKVSQQLAGLTISSATHPTQSSWYSSRSLTLSWNQPSDIASFDYSLAGPSTKNGSLTATTLTFGDLADGIWTFNLTGKSSKGDRTASYKAQIDGGAPDAFTVSVKQSGLTDPFPVISYTATDTLSGIQSYEVTVESRETKKTTETSLKLDRQTPGKHTVTVKAIDGAGNSSSANTQFQVEGFDGPAIESYPSYIAALQAITLKGQGLFGTTIKLYVDDKLDSEFVVREHLTDAQKQATDPANTKDDQIVEWTYAYKGVLWPGHHQIYAVQVKPDTSESNPSNTISVRVLGATISLGAVVIPMAFVAMLLLVIIIGLALLFLFLYRHAKRKVSSWRQPLFNLKSQIDNEMSSLEDKVESEVDKTVDKSRQLRHDISQEVKKAERAIDQSIEDLSRKADQSK